jgi:hypothetical protein
LGMRGLDGVWGRPGGSDCKVHGDDMLAFNAVSILVLNSCSRYEKRGEEGRISKKKKKRG